MNVSGVESQVTALRTTAGWLARPEVYTLVLTGEDRVRFLNGMVTTDVAKLAPGQGQLSIKATPKGRVEGMLRVRCLSSALHIEVEEVSAQAVADGLAKMIIMDDVQMSDGTSDRAVFSVVGPMAAEKLSGLGLELPAAAHGFATTGAVTVIQDEGLGPRGFQLHVSSSEAAAWSAKFTEAGLTEVSMAAFDVLRVEQGVPRDGVDVDNDTIPMEARLEPAVDFSKGCFVGQEVIARAHNLGGVKHKLVGLQFEGGVPMVGAKLTADADGKDTGEVTSAVMSPTLERPIGLGYVRIAHEAVGTVLRVGDANDSNVRAQVAALPFISGA
ncbi:MAG: glycine cleavage T C-terminal barrel domain-containing protein [Myxococcota bacterium]